MIAKSNLRWTNSLAMTILSGQVCLHGLIMTILSRQVCLNENNNILRV